MQKSSKVGLGFLGRFPKKENASPPRANCNPAVGQGNESARFDNQTLGNGNFGDAVISPLTLGSPPPLSDLLAPNG